MISSPRLPDKSVNEFDNSVESQLSYSKKTDELIFLEYPTQIESFLSTCQLGESNDTSSGIIALNPAVQASLKHRGQEAQNSLPYLTQTSRTRAWRKSAELTEWMREHFDFEDNLGVHAGYVENLVWYTRWLTNYLLWSAEIVNNAITAHHAKSIMVFHPLPGGPVSPYADENDPNFYTVARRLAEVRGLDFRASLSAIRSPAGKRIKDAGRWLATNIAPNPLVARLHRQQLKQLASREPVLFTSERYRMNILAESMTREQAILPVLLSDWGSNRSLGWPVTNGVIPPFTAEARLGLLGPLSCEDQASRSRLADALDSFADDVARSPEVFSYLNILFADVVAHKIRQGIGPSIMGLHRRAASHQTLLSVLRPSLVLSNGCRVDDMIVGELCGYNGIPAMMITHGSHVPPANEAERFEWSEHAKRLINAPFQITALQSPLAEEFRQVFPGSAQGARTGPLIWAKVAEGQQNAELRRSLVGDSEKYKVVVHAGTPKGRMGMRFHISETPDEYVQSISDLVEAVETIPDTRLIVMFRPSEEISLDDLTTLLPTSDKTIISVKDPLVEVLGFADILVSFSSTVIEEALLNKVPVLLYGGGGRYKFIDVPEPAHEGLQPPGSPAVYHAKNSEDLPDALRMMLNISANEQINGARFAPYVYLPEQLTSIYQLVDSVRLVPTSA